MKKRGRLFIVLLLAALVLSGCYYSAPTSRTVDTYSTSTHTVRTSTYYGGGAYPHY
ncbi:MAG: hypothetical protein Q3M30_02880 [Candidatus Electrothrix sp. Rat3]|nr:hypothetical protein [Candidatus Electrothrix rattekaaiensis]